MGKLIDFLFFLTILPFAIFGVIVGAVLVRAAWWEWNNKTFPFDRDN